MRPGTGRPIVVGIDEDGSTLALTWAAREAALGGRPLRLVHAKPDPYAVTMSAELGLALLAPWQATPANAVDILTAGLHTVRLWQPEVAVSAYTELGDPANVLLHQASDAAMVVLGRHGPGKLDSLLTGGIQHAVTARASCPVVTVVAQPIWPDAPIVVAADGTTTGALAMRFAFAQAARRHAPLRVQHLPRRRWRRSVGAELAADVAAQIAACAAQFAARGDRVEVTVGQPPGDPVGTLIRSAADAQLLVIGARAPGVASVLLTSSVSHTLLRGAPCPLAVIRDGCLVAT